MTFAKQSSFRSAPLRKRSLYSVVPRLVALVGGAGFLTFSAIERFPEYLGPLPALTASQTVTGPVTKVRDGDTIEVAGVPVRFGSLDCAENGTIAGHKAKVRITEITAGRELSCALNGRRSFDRQIGSCRMAEGGDLAAQMIGEGLCGRYW